MLVISKKADTDRDTDVTSKQSIPKDSGDHIDIDIDTVTYSQLDDDDTVSNYPSSSPWPDIISKTP